LENHNVTYSEDLKDNINDIKDIIFIDYLLNNCNHLKDLDIHIYLNLHKQLCIKILKCNYPSNDIYIINNQNKYDLYILNTCFQIENINDLIKSINIILINNYISMYTKEFNHKLSLYNNSYIIFKGQNLIIVNEKEFIRFDYCDIYSYTHKLYNMEEIRFNRSEIEWNDI
jgi:hypothetical protein